MKNVSTGLCFRKVQNSCYMYVVDLDQIILLDDDPTVQLALHRKSVVFQILMTMDGRFFLVAARMQKFSFGRFICFSHCELQGSCVS